MITLRPYQEECINSIPESGSYLVQLATGLGKTVIFTSMPRKPEETMLIIAHREELVNQPVKYFDCPVGIEMAGKSSNGEKVVIASIQSLVRRLQRFDPDHFDIIITDEAHHAAASTYKKIYKHFNARLHLGFTATPNRGDEVRLDDVFKRIIYKKSLRWGVENRYLSNIHCIRITVDYDISQVSKRMGDYAPGELESAMNTEPLNQAIAEIYSKQAVGQTLIFATSVQHCEDIAKEIPGAVAVTGDTKNRESIISDFTSRKIPVLVNCMVFTEGTDIPLIETIIIARPTKNSSLYQQMVGRGLRLYPGKEKLILIDLVGITGSEDICTAPSLIGFDMKTVPKTKEEEIQGDLFELPEIIERESNCIESWIRNVTYVNIWAKEQNYRTHGVNYTKLPNGDFVVKLPKNFQMTIPAQDELGYTTTKSGDKLPMQKAFDMVYKYLSEYKGEEASIWNVKKIKNSWGNHDAGEKQLDLIERMLKTRPDNLTKFEASQVINRLLIK